ncbi:outer surface protein VlsE (plasmid) [Borreliella burgdorferi 118a]|uniref:Variable large protein n=1 Tax=Borreliella burgdorferi 118a TaxID=476210 RepID=A0A7U4DIN9_BORBG|nr:variable large family protein [Borreliella burgdorferi]ACN92753.1 outer surface protein VlsE [Borreliella burgdorferi 118a]
MIEAAKKIAGATDGGVKIGEVGTANNQGAAANQASVNGIADGMKEIVDAGGKDALKAGGAAGADDNKEAGKLFGGTAGAAGASDNDIGKAAAAVNAVSGEQILKAIVDAAGGGDKVGAAANAATNPIAAAIGTNDAQGADFAAGGMNNSSEKIAAAIVLRGMAKDGKFSLAAHNDARKAKVKSVVR